jgi:FAD/FMN-containing dehydrogenase
MAFETADADKLRAQLKGDLFARGEDGWDEARFGFNVTVDPRPPLVAVPANEADIVEVVRFATDAGLRVAAQSAAHNPGPLGSLDETILLRTTSMRGVAIDRAARRARAAAGASWSELVPGASEIGLAALHGSAPGVGIVGYHLGGGSGWYSRRHGLACNHVTGFDVVGADCETWRVDAESDPELFWALRGGGGGYAVVSAVEFELLEMPEVYAGALFFPFERAAEVLHAWDEWTATVPEEMTSVSRVMQFPPIEDIPEPLRGKAFTILEAIFIGGEVEGAELTAPLRELGPMMNSLATVPPVGIADLHMDPPGPVSGVSEHMLLDLTPEAIDDMLEVVGPGSGSTLTSVELRHGGGALSRAGADAGALATLPGSHNMFAVASTPDPSLTAPARERLDRLTAALAPYDAGRYLSFCENATEFSTAFPPETCDRLRETKTKYDPDGVFRANHEVGPA